MPIDPNATTEITAFRWVPDFAEGLVRDLRIRWALEEIERPYRVRLLDALNPRPADYFQEQPFGQVPAYRDEQVQLFESRDSRRVWSLLRHNTWGGRQPVT